MTAEDYDDGDDETTELFREIAVETVTGLICKIMKEKDVSRVELAKRLRKTPGWITQLLDGEKNKTVATLSDVFVALGHSLQFYAGKLNAVEAARFGDDRAPSHADAFVEVMQKEFDGSFCEVITPTAKGSWDTVVKLGRQRVPAEPTTELWGGTVPNFIPCQG
ncbi:hypothetical protein Pla108_40960 [Botrimarina colliarenosi]|uniref:Uncharacterized protein n=1 Tax=Botrimarina colliarenosi TaxID=2528001 RepID=A0A5C5ZZH3_9BACT|nr:hypothetical protein [Botrimarina colliarenosi]TWT92470.1 hypothetical protein Pla108_40960 [Botrimarina colliarenosi]